MKEVVLTEEMFYAMVHGKSAEINDTMVSIPENSELKFIDVIEQKLVKEYGLDGTQEEEK
ncbi:MAG: hypothetical protein HRT72_09320 [Flavobacteriales bacterium]|nr:hypothetical protein [Flavobacteriales bacterium]